MYFAFNISSKEQFDQIIGCEFLSGRQSVDIPEIPEACNGCEVLNDFVDQIKQRQASKEATMKLGAMSMDGYTEEYEDAVGEEPNEQDKDIERFMMRMQDAGIESASTAIEACVKAMKDTIAACSSGVAQLDGEVGGVTYTKNVCTFTMQVRCQDDFEPWEDASSQIDNPADQEED